MEYMSYCCQFGGLPDRTIAAFQSPDLRLALTLCLLGGGALRYDLRVEAKRHKQFSHESENNDAYLEENVCQTHIGAD